MEAEPEEFHSEVRAAFLRRAAAAPGRYLVVEAVRPRDEVAAAVLVAVLDRLGEPHAAGIPAPQRSGRELGEIPS
jgi:dTMP kinase